MSPLDPEVPPAGEEIHLPGPSLQPFLLTVGLTVALIGVTTSPVISIIAAVFPSPSSSAGWPTPAATSTSCRSTTTADPSAAARPGGPPASPAPQAAVGEDGTSQIEPSAVQARTMSRMDTIPRTSSPSHTMRCRNPPRTIATAASSIDQSGAA